MKTFVLKAIHQNDGYEYGWNLSYDSFCLVSESLNNINEDQAVLVLVHTCYGPKIVMATSVTASSHDGFGFEKSLTEPLWLTVVNKEEVGEYIPDFFPSDDYQEEEELNYPQRVIEEEPFETYTIPNGWSLDQVLSFFREEVAPQYRGETLYFEGIDGNNIRRITIRESEDHESQNEVAVWDQLQNTLSIGC